MRSAPQMPCPTSWNYQGYMDESPNRGRVDISAQDQQVQLQGGQESRVTERGAVAFHHLKVVLCGKAGVVGCEQTEGSTYKGNRQRAADGPPVALTADPPAY